MNKKRHRATARKKPSVATDTASSPTGWRLYSWLPCPDTSSTQTLGGRMIFKPIKHHTVNILSVLQVQNETPDLNYFWLIHWESLLWYLTLPKYLMSSTCILRTFFPLYFRNCCVGDDFVLFNSDFSMTIFQRSRGRIKPSSSRNGMAQSIRLL